MNTDGRLTRRSFLRAGAGVSTARLLGIGGASLMTLTQAACTARESRAPFVVLSDGEARDLAAIAARVLPTTETPGATEAGVVYFFDAAFDGAMSDALDFARSGLVEFNAALAVTHPGAAHLSSLAAADQDAFLQARENSDFFQLIRVMTLIGMFAMSKYGGNKDGVGWQLVGFDGSHGGWQYPFGHYDAEIHGGSYDGQ